MPENELTVEEEIQIGKLKQRNRVINFTEGIVLMAFGLWTAVITKTYQLDSIVYLLSTLLVVIGVLYALNS